MSVRYKRKMSKSRVSADCTAYIYIYMRMCLGCAVNILFFGLVFDADDSKIVSYIGPEPMTLSYNACSNKLGLISLYRLAVLSLWNTAPDFITYIARDRKKNLKEWNRYSAE
jgi:hypothetical protein